MRKKENITKNYSIEYLELINSALINSSTFGFKNKPRVSFEEQIGDDDLIAVRKYILESMYPYLHEMLPTYWGNSCQFLSAHIFAYLSSLGVKAEIVIGEVEVNGTLEFDTTLEGLKDEFYAQEALCGGQYLHAWISLGGDAIIDAGLPDRMIKNYKFPEQFMPPIIVDRASDISLKYRAKHQPLILGTDFFAKTNPPDPLELLEIYNSRSSVSKPN